jgi:menaquinone-dependent protoporphyrinogen IX oxidase
MGEIVIIYKSRYGFTKQYAQWIAQELGADLLDAGKVKPMELANYRVIVYGGGLYAGGVNGISLLTKSFEAIKDKALYLFTVGAADVTDEQNTRKIRSALGKALTPQMQKRIKVYHFRGGIDYPRLSLIHRIMMGLMRKMLQSKPQAQLSSEEKSMLETYGQAVDFSDKTTIGPLIADIKAGGVVS